MAASRLVRQRRTALTLQAAGFLALMLVFYLDEYLDLPHWLFHAAPTPWRPEEIWLEMVLLGVVAVASLWVTLHLLRRLARETAYIPVCAWCHRVRDDRGWVRYEEYLALVHGADATHGICPECEVRVAAGS